MVGQTFLSDLGEVKREGGVKLRPYAIEVNGLLRLAFGGLAMTISDGHCEEVI